MRGKMTKMTKNGDKPTRHRGADLRAFPRQSTKFGSSSRLYLQLLIGFHNCFARKCLKIKALLFGATSAKHLLSARVQAVARVFRPLRPAQATESARYRLTT